MRAKEYAVLFKDTFLEWSKDRAPRMGAALAYYVTFSLAPLLLISISVMGLVFGEQAARGELFEQIESTVGASAAQSIQDILSHTQAMGGNVIMMVVGFVILLVGASVVFAELQDSLNQIWKVPQKKGTGILNTLRRRFLSFAMVLGIAFLLLVSLVVSAVLSALAKFLTPEAMPGGVYLWQGVDLLVSLGFITLLFALIYKILPDAEVRWRDVFVGGALAAILFTVGKFLLGLYLGQTSTVSSFGAAGSFVVILVWVYYSAQILFFGAEFTRLYSLRQQHLPETSSETQCAPEEKTEPSWANGASQGSKDPGRGNGKARGSKGPQRLEEKAPP